ncbi:hypothetical protein, partial [Paraglaciecola sp.]|uniref:hypothetical protein n=1 Tax=Paraglaciecola sp. TaxID=1920173 RepID=UPI003EF25F83
WISAIASSLAVIGIFLLWKQLKADHERSRREKAIELILMWANNLNENATSARKFVEELSAEQCRMLFNQEPFFINEKYQPLFESCFKSAVTQLEIDKREGKIFLTESEISHVRWLTVTYLNSIEGVLSAWRHNVADKDIISEQLRFLISPEKGHYLLRDLRIAAGGAKSYPSIEAFVKCIEENSDTFAGKKKIV